MRSQSSHDQTLKTAVRSEINSAQLNQDQLDKLNQLQGKGTLTSQATNQRKKNIHIKFAWAAALALVVINLIWLYPSFVSHFGHDIELARSEKIDLIAAEIVRNHLHRKPLEIESNNQQAVLAYFTRLDFRPVTSSYLSSLDIESVGGRYCSIQTKPAAFLNYKSINNERSHTVYQVPYDSDKFPRLPSIDKGETPLTTWSSGVKVTLWREKGLLFAMTD